MNRRPLILFLAINIIFAACNLPGAAQPAATPQPPAASETTSAMPPTVTALPDTPNPSETPTPAPTATETPVPPTPTITETPGPTATATFAFPTVVVNKQAHCRYGPHTAYLHAADLYPGDTGSVRGRFQLSKWLYIKFDKLNYFCWVAPSVVDVTGDVSTLYYAEVKLPGPSIYYNAPETITATREGKRVTITWSQVVMTQDKDRGYFINLFVCQDGVYLWWPVSFPDQYTTSYKINDEGGCPAPSGGKFYTVEKHGYSNPKDFYWPPP